MAKDSALQEHTSQPQLGAYWSRAGRKLLVLAGFAALCLILIHLTGLKDYLQDIQQIKDQLRQLGAWGPGVFTAASAALVALGAPRLIFCALGGLAFGFVEGLIWSQIGTLLGSYLTFCFARWGGREWAQAKLAQMPGGRLQQFLDNPSLLGVFFLRQLPVGGLFINLFLGLTRVGTAAFLLGSLLGFLPEAVVVTLIGSGLGKDSISRAGLQILVALACAGIVLLSSLLRRKLRGGGSSGHSP
ncbi:MAG: TVP38/TMEM64 family protein [Desulfohalobiaceae bacterium]